ncbi:MAG: hypothetical protein ACE5F9_00905 [Phycisphaerae bacterium]
MTAAPLKLRTASLTPAASFLAHGLFAQMTQILLLRELLVVLDGDEMAIGTMLAAWLAWTGLGAIAATRLTRRFAPDRTLAAVIATAVLSVPPAIVLIRLAPTLLDTPTGTPLPLLGALLLSTTSTAIPCLCVGMIFPLMVRLADTRPALAYGAEAVGALLAGLAFLFVLVQRASPITIALVSGLIFTVTAACLVALEASHGRRTLRALLVMTGLLLVAAPFGNAADLRLERLRWRTRLPGRRLVESRESPYGRYALLESAGQFSLFLDGKILCDLPDPYATGLAVHTTLLQRPPRGRILLIGRVSEAAIGQALHHRPDHIDAVEIDTVPLALLRAHLPSGTLAGPDSPELHRHPVDPIAWLRQSSDRYDAILVDMPDPTTLGLNRFYSSEFIASAAAHLLPGGILALTLSSQSDYLGPVLLARNALAYHTVRRVLPDTLAAPGDTCLILAKRPDGLAKAAAPALTLDAETLAARSDDRKLDIPAYIARLYGDVFAADRVAAVNRELAAWPERPEPTDPLAETIAPDRPPALNSSAAVNTNLRPRACWATRLLEARRYHPDLLPVLRRLPIATRWTLGCVALAGLLTALRVRRTGRGRRRATVIQLVIVAGAAGFSAMTLQILLLLWFQSCAGQVYQQLAILTAAFMAGLAAGSIAATRLPRPRIGLFVTQSAMLAAGLVLPFVFPALSDSAWTAAMVLTGLIGGLLGMHFACAAALWPPAEHSRSASGGWLYGADLLGGAVAAFVMAGVLITVDGFAAAGRWASAFAGVAFITSLMLVRQSPAAAATVASRRREDPPDAERR